MDDQYLAEFAVTAQAKLAEARAALKVVDPADPVYRKPAEEMVEVCQIIVSGVTSASTESQLRSTIAELKEAMSGGLDAAAFMTAQNVIDVIRDILGDEVVDTGPVSRTTEDAIRFISRSIEPDAKARLRTALHEDPGQLRSSFRLGMSVRNTLRSAGFTEASLGVDNLDDVWFDVLSAALLLQNDEAF